LSESHIASIFCYFNISNLFINLMNFDLTVHYMIVILSTSNLFSLHRGFLAKDGAAVETVVQHNLGIIFYTYTLYLIMLNHMHCNLHLAQITKGAVSPIILLSIEHIFFVMDIYSIYLLIYATCNFRFRYLIYEMELISTVLLHMVFTFVYVLFLSHLADIEFKHFLQ
ncbi:hypothetical protein ACJX0J_034640, partial [Zea mays]